MHLKLATVAILAAIIFDPTGGLIPHFKTIALVVFIYVSAIHGIGTHFGALSARFRSQHLLVYVGVFCLLAIYGVLVHFLRGDYIGGDFNIYTGAFIYFVSLCVGVASGVGLRFYYQTAIVLLSGLAAVIWILYLVSLGIGWYPLYVFGHVHDTFVFSNRSYAGVQLPYVYYYTSPMLVMPAAHWIVRLANPRSPADRSARIFSGLMLAMVLGALFLSGTRTNILLALCLIAMTLWRLSRLAFWVFAGASSMVLIRAWSSLRDVVSASGGSVVAQSNLTKADLLTQYNHLSSDLLGLVFGYGLGSCVDSPSRGRCMTVTELTYLDIFREFGIVVGVVCLALLVYPAFRSRVHPSIRIGYVLYLGAALTNPYVFSSNGLCVVSLAVLASFAKDSVAEFHRGEAPVRRGLRTRHESGLLSRG